jgi:hypothetical protein
MLHTTPRYSHWDRLEMPQAGLLPLREGQQAAGVSQSDNFRRFDGCPLHQLRKIPPVKPFAPERRQIPVKTNNIRILHLRDKIGGNKRDCLLGFPLRGLVPVAAVF